MNVVGVDFPGVPGVILGHNPYIAWGATDAEPQVVYYYVEVTSQITQASTTMTVPGYPLRLFTRRFMLRVLVMCHIMSTLRAMAW